MGASQGISAPSFHIELPRGGDGAFRASVRNLVDSLLSPEGQVPRFVVTIETSAAPGEQHELEDDQLYQVAKAAGVGENLESFAVSWDSPDLQVKFETIDGGYTTYRGRMLSPGQALLAEALDFARSREEGADESVSTARAASLIPEEVAAIVSCLDPYAFEEFADESILAIAEALTQAGVPFLPAEVRDRIRRAAHVSTDVDQLLAAASSITVH